MTIKQLLFPFKYSDSIQLNDCQREKLKYLYEEDIMGEELVAEEYAIKTGRTLFTDTMISAILWTLIFTCILITLLLIF